MPTTYYYTVDGEIIGEHTAGQSRLDYIPDALGSVVATVDQTLTVQSTARYKPYGATLSSTGVQPAFGWVGTTGSRRTGRSHIEQYNWHRMLSVLEGSWTTVDPLWPDEKPYGYVNGNPTNWVDPTGEDQSGNPYCSCNPPAIHGHYKGKAAKCLLQACETLCKKIQNALDSAEALCENGAYSQATHQINDELAPCLTGGTYTALCGRQITCPDGSLFNGAYANKSNYPCPLPQVKGLPLDLTGDYCDVECKMRVCCNQLVNGDPLRTFAGWVKKCAKL